MKPSNLSSDQKRDAIVAAAEDKKANYVTEIDLRGKTVIADFFIICSGTSNIHIRAIADGIVESLEKIGLRATSTEGYSEASWVVLDYGDVIVHVMSEGERDRYRIESLWTREVKIDPTGQAQITPADTTAKSDEPAAE